MKRDICSNRIRDIRKFKGITQEELAELTGLSSMSIRRYENGERTPNENTLRKIAMALESSVKELLGIEEEDIQVKVERAYKIADSLVKQKQNNDLETDLFVQMFGTDVLQELGRRGVEIKERKIKRIFESNGKSYAPLSKELFDEKVRDYIVDLLYKHEIFPKTVNSLMSIGYSEGNAYYMMELTKLHDDSVGTLPPDYFDRVSEMATLIDLSVRHDKHGEKE